MNVEYSKGVWLSMHLLNDMATAKTNKTEIQIQGLQGSITLFSDLQANKI